MTTTNPKRRTIASTTTIGGIGLHLGKECNLTFKPAKPRDGIRFVRTDIPGSAPIRVSADNVGASERRTQLGFGEEAIHTVEHVLAAVTALEIDDLVIEMDGPEPPICDGSALPFWESLNKARIQDTDVDADYLTISEPVRIIDGASVYEAYPSDSLKLDVTIDFPHPVIGKQSGSYSVTRDSFITDLASARTFGFMSEVETLKAKGLIQGASPKNAIVLDATQVVEESGDLRWPDEFVRHKAMDIVGDLTLAGARVRARIVAVHPSHRGTITLVKELVKRTKTSMTENDNNKNGGYGIDEIMKVLPHRYPFLLVDKVLEIDPKKHIVGIKNVTINEPFFQGHFPGHAIMPGVLIVEAMAQVGGMLLMGSVDDPESKVVYFMSLDNVKFRKPVKPGDQLRFELEMVQIRGMVCKMRGLAKVDGEIVCEADMAAMVRDR